jgi:hypothetical protein
MSLLVIQRDHGAADIQSAAVFPQMPAFVAGASLCLRFRQFFLGGAGRAVFGHVNSLASLADHFIRRVAEHLLRARIPERHAAFRIH